MNSKPTILVIAPFPPPVHGSAMVSEAIRRSAVLNDAFRMDFVNLSTSRRMGEIGRRTPWKLIRFVGAYFRVFTKLLIRRYDLCYLAITCHGIGFLKDAPFVWLCKLFGRRVAIHQHNKGMACDVHRWPYHRLMPMTYRNTSVILLSWRLYPDVAEVVRRNQVRICPNGIAEHFSPPCEGGRGMFRLQGNKAGDICGDIPRLLFLSNLLESKGVWILLDACRVLKDKGYDFVCDMVGSETGEITRIRLEEEVRVRGLQGRVVFHGPQYGEDKLRFFRRADVFVQPTYDDCFPLTILEAMSFALPVVATDEGAIADMVKDGKTGFVCERKNVSSIVNALEKLLNDKDLRKQMGEKARSMYEEGFTLDAFSRRLRDVLSDILN